MNDQRFDLMLPGGVKADLQAMAGRQGCTASEIVRRLIIQAAPLHLSGGQVLATKYVTTSGEVWATR